jgi:hypothetical protein
MASREILGTHQKALQINLDPTKYGTFAEIGAGQEVARWFFRVGGASGTVAKSISAYDMVISDAIYGQAERYVSRQRLETMLGYEYNLLLERLNEKRGSSTRFFVFGETVTAKSYSRMDDAHGWLGIRYQIEPGHEPSQIIIHVRMWDKENVQQQEALGILGVNLIHAALYLHDDPETLLVSLVDNVGAERIEVDLIQFSGPGFEKVDDRLMALKLVQNGLTNAALFKANGEIIQPADAFYKKSILVERGSFRPISNVTLDMLRCAQAQFVQEPQVQGEEIVTVMEMTLKNLTEGDTIDAQDFLDRVDILGALGKTVLISDFGEYFRLAAYFFRYSKKMHGIVMGVPSLREIFDEKYYTNLAGGILESFGRMFKNDLKLYVYPLLDPQTGALITATNLRVAPHLRHLHAYLVENRYIENILDYNEKYLPIFAPDIVKKIRSGDTSWDEVVPPEVAKMIRERNFFGCKGVC